MQTNSPQPTERPKVTEKKKKLNNFFTKLSLDDWNNGLWNGKFGYRHVDIFQLKNSMMISTNSEY